MPNTRRLHEDLERRDEVRGSSNRAFGMVFAVVFGIIALWPLLGDGTIRRWAAALAGGFLLLAFVVPRALAPLNRVWTLFGLALHRIVSPLVLGLLFYGVVLPTGLTMRLVRKRTIPIGFDPSRTSYWVMRDPPGPPPEGMKNQF